MGLRNGGQCVTGDTIIFFEDEKQNVPIADLEAGLNMEMDATGAFTREDIAAIGNIDEILKRPIKTLSDSSEKMYPFSKILYEGAMVQKLFFKRKGEHLVDPNKPFRVDEHTLELTCSPFHVLIHADRLKPAGLFEYGDSVGSILGEAILVNRTLVPEPQRIFGLSLANEAAIRKLEDPKYSFEFAQIKTFVDKNLDPKLRENIDFDPKDIIQTTQIDTVRAFTNLINSATNPDDYKDKKLVDLQGKAWNEIFDGGACLYSNPQFRELLDLERTPYLPSNSMAQFYYNNGIHCGSSLVQEKYTTYLREDFKLEKLK